jgi:hypothetical protein
MIKIFPVIFIFFYFVSKGQIITTIIGNGVHGYSGDGGQATLATIRASAQITFDKIGNIYFGDEINNAVRKVDTLGVITTVAGNGVGAGTFTGGTYTGDGGLATLAGLTYPMRVAFDSIGNMYIPDVINNCIRKVDLTGIISTIAGNGGSYNSGDGGLAINAGIYRPVYVMFDAQWNMYIVEENGSCIRKVNKLGVISTIVGNGSLGYGGDGGIASSATLYYPSCMAIDKLGNIFIADYWNNRIRKVNTSGIISTVAGNGVAGYNGDGGLANLSQLNNPFGVTVDTIGNLYIADMGNNRVRKVNYSGIISTVAGNGSIGYTGDLCLADTTRLNSPTSVEIDRKGNLYITDYGNARIRKVDKSILTSLENFESNNYNFKVYPNPCNNSITISATFEIEEIEIFNSIGERVINFKPKYLQEKLDVSYLSNGIYILKANKQQILFVKE